MTASHRPRSRSGSPARWAGAALIAIPALACAAFFLAVAALRLTYPFDIEWIESSVAGLARQLAKGVPLYGPPRLGHVPLLYGPTFFYASAALIRLGIPELVAGRLVSIAGTLLIAASIATWVLRAGAGRLAALAALGLFFAAYGYTDFWYDLGRVDVFPTSLIVAGALLLSAQSRPALLLSALLIIAAILGKQILWLVWAPVILAFMFHRGPRRGLAFGLLTALPVFAAIAWLDARSGGWASFYLFRLPAEPGLSPRHLAGWLFHDLAYVAPMLILSAWALPRLADPPVAYAAALAAGGLAASAFSRGHVGGWANVLLFQIPGPCIMSAIGARELVRRLGPAARIALAALCAWQMGLLLLPGIALRGIPVPKPEKIQFGRRITAMVAELERSGPVWTVYHDCVGATYGAGAVTIWDARGPSRYVLDWLWRDLDQKRPLWVITDGIRQVARDAPEIAARYAVWLPIDGPPRGWTLMGSDERPEEVLRLRDFVLPIDVAAAAIIAERAALQRIADKSKGRLQQRAMELWRQARQRAEQIAAATGNWRAYLRWLETSDCWALAKAGLVKSPGQP